MRGYLINHLRYLSKDTEGKKPTRGNTEQKTSQRADLPDGKGSRLQTRAHVQLFLRTGERAGRGGRPRGGVERPQMGQREKGEGGREDEEAAAA